MLFRFKNDDFLFFGLDSKSGFCSSPCFFVQISKKGSSFVSFEGSASKANRAIALHRFIFDMFRLKGLLSILSFATLSTRDFLLRGLSSFSKNTLLAKSTHNEFVSP